MELTDEQLEVRAKELANFSWPYSDQKDAGWAALFMVSKQRLNDARESLKMLKEFAATVDECGGDYPGLDAHIAHLKALLGITDTNN